MDRRLIQARQAIDPPQYAGGASRRDPSGFGQGYSPAIQGDEINMRQVQDALQSGVLALHDAIDRAEALNLPPQLIQASFHVVLQQFGVAGAVRLIPKNPRRQSFLVSNFLERNNCLFSFDKPIDSGGGVGAGIPIGTYYQESNGAVGINDIWVFCNDDQETYPFWLMGYEGGISIAGNKR